MKNECLKTRKVDNPYEVWKTADGTWEWKVLKKWQADDDKPYARWFCAVKSPFTHGSFELGDVYVKEIKEQAERVITVEEYEDWDNKKGKFAKDDCECGACEECVHGTKLFNKVNDIEEDEDETQQDMNGRLCEKEED